MLWILGSSANLILRSQKMRSTNWFGISWLCHITFFTCNLLTIGWNRYIYLFSLSNRGSKVVYPLLCHWDWKYRVQILNGKRKQKENSTEFTTGAGLPSLHSPHHSCSFMSDPDPHLSVDRHQGETEPRANGAAVEISDVEQEYAVKR